MSEDPAEGGAPAAHEPAPVLTIDVGGSGIKAARLTAAGKMATERVRVETPHPCPPAVFLDAVQGLVAPLAGYEVVAVGFPGLVRSGKVLTAPNLDAEAWPGFDLARALAKRLGAPVRVVNDADLHGLAAARGRGLEMLVTLGTGFGTAIVHDGVLGPHLEIAHIPFRKGETYEEQLGNAARKRVGEKKWSNRFALAVECLRTLTRFDRLYVGGGNADKLVDDLPEGVRRVPNELGLSGGARLWADRYGKPKATKDRDEV